MRIILKHDQPIYIEIVDAIKNQIDLGVLQTKEMLPSVRQLAKDIGVNPNTVSRAYKILEEEGYVKAVSQVGVFVDKTGGNDRLSIVKNQLKIYREQGIKKETLEKIINELYGGEKHD